MRALDTNVVIRLITHDQPRQASAAEQVIKGGAWLPAVALAEATWVLTSVYEFSPAQLIQALEMLLQHEQIVVEDAPMVERAVATFRANRRVAFVDCLVVEMARKAGCVPLATFDRDLAKLDGTELITS